MAVAVALGRQHGQWGVDDSPASGELNAVKSTSTTSLSETQPCSSSSQLAIKPWPFRWLLVR